MNKFIDLSGLPVTYKGIDWANIKDVKVPFSYENISGELTIKHLDKEEGKLLVEYDGNSCLISRESLRKCMLGHLLSPQTYDFRYSVGEVITIPKCSFVIIDRCRTIGNSGYSRKTYKCKCLNCSNEFDITEAHLERGSGCPVCTKGTIVKGVNDMATTNPEMASMLKNIEDAYTHSEKSEEYLLWVCPDCKSEVKATPSYVGKYGLPCKKCSDGISYPNKFMGNLLDELNISYEREVMFDWCKFKDLKGVDTFGKYDFVIEDEKIIIEMDGGLGHEGGIMYPKSTKTLEETIYKDKIKDKLAIENGYNIIRISSMYFGNESNFEVCKAGILGSELAMLYDLSNVKWDFIHKNSIKSITKKVCIDYENGIPIVLIAKKYHVSRETVYYYLKTGTECGLCNYEPGNNKEFTRLSSKERNSKPFYCLETGQYFRDASLASEIAEEVMGKHLNYTNLATALRKGKAYNGYHWIRITKQEFNNMKDSSPNIVYGDYFMYDENQNLIY